LPTRRSSDLGVEERENTALLRHPSNLQTSNQPSSLGCLDGLLSKEASWTSTPFRNGYGRRTPRRRGPPPPGEPRAAATPPPPPGEPRAAATRPPPPDRPPAVATRPPPPDRPSPASPPAPGAGAGPAAAATRVPPGRSGPGGTPTRTGPSLRPASSRRAWDAATRWPWPTCGRATPCSTSARVPAVTCCCRHAGWGPPAGCTGWTC